MPLGFSHDGNFTLFRVGETASDALQQFAELGKADLLENRFAEPVPLVAKKAVNDTETNEVSDQPDPEQNKDAPQDVSKSILDGFTGPEIPEGVGESISRFFVDGLHSKVTNLYFTQIILFTTLTEIKNRRPSRSVRQAIESIEDHGKPINLVRIFNWSLLSTSGFPI